MGINPTQKSIIGQFINGRNATDDFLQLATNNGGTVFAWIDAGGILRGTFANPSSGAAGPNGSIQINSSGSFSGDSRFTFDSTTGQVSFGNSPKFSGPGPWIDVTAYGAVARDPNTVQTTTATTTAASGVVTLASAIDFVNGDGIVIWGAGAATSQSTPAAPTVLAASVTGSKTINYKVVGVDINGGLTAASPATTIANAPDNFTATPVAISSISQSSGVVSVVTSAPISAVVGQQVTIVGVTGAGAGFVGAYAVATAADSTHFTYTLAGNAGAGTVSGASTARISNTYNITAITRSGTTISVTTNSAHNFRFQNGGSGNFSRTIAIIQGVDQFPLGPTNDMNGQYSLLSASGSSLTMDSAISATETGILTGTGAFQPTVTVYPYVVVTCPAISGTTVAYYVYADYGNTGTYVLVGKTLPNEKTFVDYGPWQSPNFQAPAYVPTTPPPAVSQNQLYAGTITSGAGTTSLVVSPVVPSSTSGTTVLHDETQAFAAALAKAAIQQGGIVYFPPCTAQWYYIFNAPLTISTLQKVNIAGPIKINETITVGLTGIVNWSADGGSSLHTTQFAQTGSVKITGLANPMMLSALSGAPIQVEGLEFGGTSSSGQTYIYSSIYTRLKNCAFLVGGGTGQGTDVPVIVTGAGGFASCPHITDCTFVGYFPGIGNGAQGLGDINIGPNIPLISFASKGDGTIGPNGIIMDGVNTFAGRGILFDGRFGQFTSQARVGCLEYEAPTTPFLMIYGLNSGGFEVVVFGVEADSQPAAIVGNWTSGFSGFVTLQDCHTSGSQNTITGSALPGVTVIGVNSPIGQNFNFRAYSQGAGSGGNNTNPSVYCASLQGSPVIMSGPLAPAIAWPYAPITGVVITDSGVGTWPATTLPFQVTAVGFNNLESAPSYPIFHTGDGSHGVNFTWNALPGVKGYNVYANGARQNSSLITVTTFTIAFVNSAGKMPTVDATGLPMVDNLQVVTPKILFTGSTSGQATIVAPAVAGTPSLTLPTVTGTLATGITSFLTSNYTNATTGMTSVTGISFAVAANTNYQIIYEGAYQTSATTANLSLQWTGPASPTAVTYTLEVAETATTLGAETVATAFSTALSATGTPTTATNLKVRSVLTLINGANAGTVQLQAAATGVGTITIIPSAAISRQ